MFTERTSVGLDVHARSVAAAAIDGVTGELVQTRLTRFTIDLQRSAPPTKIVNVHVVNVDGTPANGYTVRQGTQVEGCSASTAAVGPDIVGCFPTAASADVCWVTADRVSLLCGGLPWEKSLYRNTSDKPISTTAATPSPQPWGLELSNGTKCRLRSGGSWDGRSDGLVGAYYCTPGSKVVLVKQGSPQFVDRSQPGWTVLMGEIGPENASLPLPEKVRVLTAYFAASP